MEENQNENTQANTEEAQGLMGEVPKTTEETKPEDQESIPHLVSTEEEGSDDGETYLRPDYIPEKFWDEKEGPDLEGTYKSLNELEKKFHRGDHNVPKDGYKLTVAEQAGVQKDDPLLQKFLATAKQQNMTQAGVDEVLTSVIEMAGDAAKTEETSREEEMKILGGNAQEIITANQNWINSMVSKKIFTEDERAELYGFGDYAGGAKILQKLRGMSGDNTPIPVATSPDPKMSQEEFKRYAQSKMNDPRYGNDMKYTNDLQKEFEDYYGNKAAVG